MDFRCPLAWRLHSNFTAIGRLWTNGIDNAPESNDALGSQADVEAHFNKQLEPFNEEKAP